MANLTTLASGSSTTLTVTEGQSIVLNNGRSDTARLQIATGPNAGRVVTAFHNGRREYGPFGAGTITVSAVSGELRYELSGDTVSPLDDDGQPLTSTENQTVRALVSRAWNEPGVPGTFGNVRNFLPLDNIAAWDDRAGAGMTVELDPTVTFDGKPSIKLTIPAGLTTARIGTLLDTAVMPRGWDLSGAVLAFRCSKVSATSGANVYVGEAAGFASNYLSWGQAPASYAQTTRDNEWLVYHIDKATTGGIAWTQAGTYVNQPARRIRIAVNLSAQAEPVVFWIGAFGVKQPRPKPTLVMTYDDGRASIYSHVWPLFKANRLPLSLAIISSAIGTNGYLTEAQLLEMYRDPTGLFEAVTHSSQHIAIDTRGDAQYVQDVVAVRDWLVARGITGPGVNHHAWVQSIWSNGGIDGLRAAGFLSARAAGQTFPHRVFSDQCIRAGDKSRWLLNCLTTLGNTKGATGMIAEVDAWRAVGGFAMLNGHDFGATSADAYTMAYSEHTPLIEYIASLRDAGSIEVMTWSQWFSTYCA